MKNALIRLNSELVEALQSLMVKLEASPSDSNRELERVLAVEATMMQACNSLRACQARATMLHLLSSSAQSKRELLVSLRAQQGEVLQAQRGAMATLSVPAAASLADE
jgi:MED7 protein